MRKRRTVNNLTEEEEKLKPDCCVCIHRKVCERYAENSFCGQWGSHEPQKEGPDPNRLWEQGEEVDF